jgi:toxin-antitoxin system PIN domain toxin
MVLVDANILVYANNLDAAEYLICKDWLDSMLSGREPVGMPWQVALAFVRLITNPKICKRPLSTARACKLVAGWLSRPQVSVIEPGQDFWPLFTEQILVTQMSGRRVSDVSLACMALEQGAALCTADKDFKRFAGLRLISPLPR